MKYCKQVRFDKIRRISAYLCQFLEHVRNERMNGEEWDSRRLAGISKCIPFEAGIRLMAVRGYRLLV